MTRKEAEALQSDLQEVFDRHMVMVGTGLTLTGVAIRSQDNRVDASNVGVLIPFPQEPPTR